MILPKVAFYTLGCKVNQNETEALSALFKQHKYEVVDFEEKADVYVINTCTVTHLGDRKSRQIIRRAIKKNPEAIIVVTGCYAQTSSEEIAKIEGVHLIIGTRDKARIVELIEEYKKTKKRITHVYDIRNFRSFEELPVDRIINRTRAYLKVQEGCEQFCTYCIIPYARGPSRSRSLESTIKEANKLVKAGFKEIILTGIHLGIYGKDLDDNIDLVDLCRYILEKTNVERLRISSIEPTEVTDELLQLISENPRFCRHLHIPLQNGDDEILKKMNRPYTTKDYRCLVEKIRKVIPDIGLTSDIMVGFPGETDFHFKNSLEFVREMNFSGLHVFKYSPRKGTPAYLFPNQVSSKEKEIRSRAMIETAKRGFENFAQRFLGKIVEVLVETPWPQGGWEGHTDNYLRVIVSGEGIKKGDIVKVYINKIDENFVLGELTNSRN